MKQGIPNKLARLKEIWNYLRQAPPASSSLEAFILYARAIDTVEDKYLGPHTYNPPPRIIPADYKTERLYITNYENIFVIPHYSGVQLLVHNDQITLISRYGAIETQQKVHEDKYGELMHFADRHDKVLFEKKDLWNHGVWEEKNR